MPNSSSRRRARGTRHHGNTLDEILRLLGARSCDEQDTLEDQFDFRRAMRRVLVLLVEQISGAAGTRWTP